MLTTDPAPSNRVNKAIAKPEESTREGRTGTAAQAQRDRMERLLRVLKSYQKRLRDLQGQPQSQRLTLLRRRYRTALNKHKATLVELCAEHVRTLNAPAAPVQQGMGFYLDWQNDLSSRLTSAQRLKRIRQKAGFSSMNHAAAALNVPRRTYMQHEAGEQTISQHYIDKYGEFFHIPPGVILYGNDLVIYPDALPNHELVCMGWVSESGKVHAFDKKHDPRRVIHQRIPSITKLEAVLIDTDALAPQYFRGDYVMFDPPVEGQNDLGFCEGRECYATMDHGRKMIGVMRRNWRTKKPHEWMIHVPNREPVLRHVYTASLVRWIMRAYPDG